MNHSFKEATLAYLESLDPASLEAQVLRVLVTKHIGRKNAVPLSELSAIFGYATNRIQNAVVVPSRKPPKKHFIGSCANGILIIESEDDVKTMEHFYENRIQCESQHLNYLRMISE